MTITVPQNAARRWRKARLGLLATVSLLIGHELVYALRYGLGADLAREMTARGHDGYWPLFLVLAGAALALLVTAAAIRDRRLRERLRSLPPRAATPHPLSGASPVGATTLPAEWRILLRQLLPIVLLLFLLQENLEELASSGRLAGLDPFMAPDALLTLPLLALVAGVAALLGGLVRWQEARLEAQLRDAVAAHHQRPMASTPAARWRRIADACRQEAILARGDLGRAPPLARFA